MKNSEDNSGPQLVPQPGGGALWSGGVPGNRGGTGRPPSALRELMRGSLEVRLPMLEQIIDDPSVRPADKIRAIDLLGKYGLGVAHEISPAVLPPHLVDDRDPREVLKETLEGIRKRTLEQ